MDFKKYSSIENIRKSSEVLLYDTIITEKIHGTNVRFYYGNGGLYVGGRNTIIYNPQVGEVKNDGYGFYNFISNHPCLEIFHETGEYDNYTFYGEFHGPGIQKGIKYSEEKDLRIFDIRHPDGNFLNWEQVEYICNKLNLKIVPVFHKGKISDIGVLNSFLNINSKCAIENGINLEDNIAEGIVIKPLIEMMDKRGDRIIVKYKSKKWAENADGVSKMPKELSKEEVEFQKQAREFASMVATEGRLHTIIEHITRDGNVEINMKRVPDFLREFVKDVMEEYEEIYSKLDKKEKNIYNKIISSQAVNLFKKYVMET